jgi:type 1 glutamine amidotransferase
MNSTHVSTQMLPDRWTRTDEWYNYKNIATDINVLLKLDESSYEGGDNNGDHPIAWYHEFDGGKSWYTGLGHTKESYSDPLFVDHLWGGIQYAAGLAAD